MVLTVQVSTFTFNLKLWFCIEFSLIFPPTCLEFDCPGDGTCSGKGSCNDSVGACICDTGFEGNICQGNARINSFTYVDFTVFKSFKCNFF